MGTIVPPPETILEPVFMLAAAIAWAASSVVFSWCGCFESSKHVSKLVFEHLVLAGACASLLLLSCCAGGSPVGMGAGASARLLLALFAGGSPFPRGNSESRPLFKLAPRFLILLSMFASSSRVILGTVSVAAGAAAPAVADSVVGAAVAGVADAAASDGAAGAAAHALQMKP